VYPEGEHRAWNIGECCHFAYRKNVNEAAFVNDILEQLREDFQIDTTRIYSTGYSDGATLSYLLACKMPHRLAAVAGISGTLFTPEPQCALPAPMPVMVVHGTADHSIPYQGHAGGPPGSVTQDHFNLSAPGVTAFWVSHDHCAGEPDTAQHGNVIRAHYRCPDGAEVVFYTILGGAHGWPGGGRGWVFSPVPPTDMSATDSVIRFFFRHQRQ
jgi:polyhydroxybutyrate depolymerase